MSSCNSQRDGIENAPQKSQYLVQELFRAVEGISQSLKLSAAALQWLTRLPMPS